MHDALQTDIIPVGFQLQDLIREIFNLIRSFSFVGETGVGETGDLAEQSGLPRPLIS